MSENGKFKDGTKKKVETEEEKVTQVRGLTLTNSLTTFTFSLGTINYYFIAVWKSLSANSKMKQETTKRTQHPRWQCRQTQMQDVYSGSFLHVHPTTTTTTTTLALTPLRKCTQRRLIKKREGTSPQTADWRQCARLAHSAQWAIGLTSTAWMLLLLLLLHEKQPLHPRTFLAIAS